jgi:hypothetical protein
MGKLRLELRRCILHPDGSITSYGPFEVRPATVMSKPWFALYGRHPEGRLMHIADLQNMGSDDAHDVLQGISDLYAGKLEE